MLPRIHFAVRLGPKLGPQSPLCHRAGAVGGTWQPSCGPGSPVFGHTQPAALLDGPSLSAPRRLDSELGSRSLHNQPSRGGRGEGVSLSRSMCCFPSCKYAHDGRFRAVSGVTATELGRDDTRVSHKPARLAPAQPARGLEVRDEPDPQLLGDSVPAGCGCAASRRGSGERAFGEFRKEGPPVVLPPRWGAWQALPLDVTDGRSPGAHQ